MDAITKMISNTLLMTFLLGGAVFVLPPYIYKWGKYNANKEQAGKIEQLNAQVTTWKIAYEELETKLEQTKSQHETVVQDHYVLKKDNKKQKRQIEALTAANELKTDSIEQQQRALFAYKETIVEKDRLLFATIEEKSRLQEDSIAFVQDIGKLKLLTNNYKDAILASNEKIEHLTPLAARTEIAEQRVKAAERKVLIMQFLVFAIAMINLYLFFRNWKKININLPKLPKWLHRRSLDS